VNVFTMEKPMKMERVSKMKTIAIRAIVIEE
jgi:hypothetical protein